MMSATSAYHLLNCCWTVMRSLLDSTKVPLAMMTAPYHAKYSSLITCRRSWMSRRLVFDRIHDNPCTVQLVVYTYSINWSVGIQLTTGTVPGYGYDDLTRSDHRMKLRAIPSVLLKNSSYEGDSGFFSCFCDGIMVKNFCSTSPSPSR